VNKKVENPSTEEQEVLPVETTAKLTCGIIMPIAGMGPDYPADHWVDVIKILHTAIERAGFIPRIVSDSEESTVIHGSIINNIYNDAIVVCDVSNKNANVMFELGMRLAFNKPVVIVKDDKTDYSFDTGNIQHENYRRDLRHNTVEKFINDLSRKIKKTYEASLNADYQSFLSYFGKFEVAKIENKSIGESEAIEKLLNKMNSMESKINSLIPKDDEGVTYVSTNRVVDKRLSIEVPLLSKAELNTISSEIKSVFPDVTSINYTQASGENRLIVMFDHTLEIRERSGLVNKIRKIVEDNSLPF
jgi:hypothetical protein